MRRVMGSSVEEAASEEAAPLEAASDYAAAEEEADPPQAASDRVMAPARNNAISFFFIVFPP